MIAKHTVLVVDNELGTRESLHWILKSNYQTRLAENPVVALRMMEEEPVDVVFSDILMGPFDGISLLQRIKEINPTVEVVMMTAFARHDSMLAAMCLGASDYLIKPFDKKQVDDVLLKVLAKRSQGLLERRVLENMKKSVDEKFKCSVNSLMQALAAKDIYTFSHSKRTAEIFKLFAKRYDYTPQEIELFKTMAALHDVGKIGIRDSVLKKSGRLTEEEFEEIKLHPNMGYHIVKHLGLDEEALDIIIHHQERYDGKGYPHGLAGEKIPLTVRLFAVVDAYDAMRGTRPYREGISRDEAVRELKKHAGTQFDPKVVCDFEKMLQESSASL